MNNFWIVFFKTLNQTLNMLTLVSVIFVFCLDMWLSDIPAPCQFFVACGKFFYGVGLSFIAAYIFYLITVHYPEVKKARTVYKVSDFPAMAIVTNIERIFIDMAEKQGRDIKRENLNEEVIKDILSSTGCYDDSTLNDIDSQGKTKAKTGLGILFLLKKLIVHLLMVSNHSILSLIQNMLLLYLRLSNVIFPSLLWQCFYNKRQNKI